MKLIRSIVLVTFLSITGNGISQNTVDLLKQHVYTLAADSLKGRGLGTPEKELAVNYIANQFKAVVLTPLGYNYRHDFTFMEGLVRVNATNVAGIIEGNDPELKDEFIVLGAHFDHLGSRDYKNGEVIFNGADDNASGVAAIIEIARQLKAQQSQLKRSVVIVAFDAEESGLIGSDRFLEDEVIAPDKIKMMFSVDMVGMYSSIQGVRLIGMGLIKNGEQTAQQIAQSTGISIDRMNKQQSIFTDSYSFLQYQIPAAAVFTGLKSPYHKPEDTAEKLDYAGMSMISEYLGNLTTTLSQQENIEALPKVIKGTPQLAWGARLGLGTTQTEYKDINYISKSRFSVEPSVFAQLRLSNTLFLQPELTYEYKNFFFDNDKASVHALTTPLSILIRSRHYDQQKANLSFLTGAYYSWLLSGQLNGSQTMFNNTFDDVDYGANLGIIMEFWKASIGLNIRYSLSDCYDSSINGDLSHSTVYFTMGWNF